MTRQNKRLALILTSALALLLMPAIARQLSNEITWTTLDFVVVGVLLLVTALLCEVVIRMTKSMKARIILCCVVLLACLATWIELAVGLFGSPLAGS